jgi:hypothetical protein
VFDDVQTAKAQNDILVDVIAPKDMFNKAAPAKKEEDSAAHFERKIEPVAKETFRNDGEITRIGFYKHQSDGRTEPEYAVFCGRLVARKDVYLGLGRKDSSIGCADAVFVTVKLPDAVIDGINLNVQKGHLDLRAPLNHLTPNSIAG